MSYADYNQTHIYQTDDDTFELMTESSYDKKTSSTKYFHLSPISMDDEILTPRIPSNYLTKIGAEDNKTPRVCFGRNIEGCLAAISANIKGKEFYIHIPEDKIKIVEPSCEQVPDKDITSEVWSLKPVNLKLFGKIKVGSAKDTPEKYTYVVNGEEKTAELYKWNWKWIEKYNDEGMVVKEASEDKKVSYSKLNSICTKILNYSFTFIKEYLNNKEIKSKYSDFYDSMDIDSSDMQKDLKNFDIDCGISQDACIGSNIFREMMIKLNKYLDESFHDEISDYKISWEDKNDGCIWLTINNIEAQKVLDKIKKESVYEEAYIDKKETTIYDINEDTIPTVLFTREISPESLVHMYTKFGTRLPGNVAVKLHSGEDGNKNYLRPEFVKDIIDYVGGTVVECNTAYPGARDTTEKHTELMEKHGWSRYFDVDIMDSEQPDFVLDIPNHNRINKDYLGNHIQRYDSMLVLSHFKGHAMGGYGGALKQLSIGCASSYGKKIIHNAGDPNGDIMKAEQIPFLESMADAASVVHSYFKGKVVYINIMCNISVDCDCDAHAHAPCMEDVGVLISDDPVAIDKACLDIVYNSNDPGKDELIERIESRHGRHTLEKAYELGVGNKEYKFVDIDTGSENDVFEENVLTNDKDILYNKDKFDSGEINLCFITGHSGSGKSTLGRNLQSGTVEHYELDDLHCIKDRFTMDNLKQYGGLIYSYFNGPGKKYYLGLDDIKNIPGSEYEDKLYPGFIHYAMSYAKTHKDRKFVVEGVWLFGASETGKNWLSPNEFDNYAFYIKGTSMMISKHRAALRDAKNDANKKIDVIRNYSSNFFIHKWKYYILDEKRIKIFREYFQNKENETVTESVVNKNISFSDNFADVQNIVNRLSKDDLMQICNGTFKNSPYVIYREVLKVNNNPAAFIDVYHLPKMLKNEACIVVACVKKYRRHGYVEILVKRMISSIRLLHHEITKLIWDTKSGNNSSNNLSEKLGFEKTKNDDGDGSEYQLMIESYSDDNMKTSVKEFSDNIMSGELFTEATIGSTTFLYDRMAKRVDAVLSDPKNVKKFNQLVNNFINKNIDKLTKSGPCDMIAFTDNDHKAFHDLFGFWYHIDNRPRVTSPNEVREIVIDFCDFTKSKQTFIQTNSSQLLFYFVIRYFTMHKDPKSLNAVLTIYSLCVYPLMFSKYFKYGVIESVMKYTIDNLTDKFIFKKSKHLFGALTTSIQNSYQFHKNYFKDAYDNKIISFIQRIRNDQNSLFKKIANEYIKNYKAGNYARETNEDYDPDTPIVDDVTNATTEVQNLVQKVTYPIIEDGIDLVRAEAAAKMSNVSVSDCRHFLTLIFEDKDVDIVQKFIESLLFLYIYENHKTARDIRSQYFIAWANSLFKKTNSKNKNINTINDILNFWASETGIYKKFASEGTRINYKKAIFFYIVLCIQKNC